MVRALAAGELAHAGDGVLLGRVDDGVGADLERLGLSRPRDLDHDHLAGAERAQALDGHRPDRPAAEPLGTGGRRWPRAGCVPVAPGMA